MINPQHVHTKLHIHFLYIYIYTHTNTHTHTHTHTHIHTHIYYEAVYVWFYRLIRCAQHSFTAHAVTLTVWQMALMFLQLDIYRCRWCCCSSTCTYFHVQATLGVSDIWRPISGGLHMYMYTKDFLLSFQRISLSNSDDEQWNEKHLETTTT